MTNEPKLITCTTCDGDGIIECPYCDGTGWGTMHMNCDVCDGTGIVGCDDCEDGFMELIEDGE